MADTIYHILRFTTSAIDRLPSFLSFVITHIKSFVVSICQKWECFKNMVQEKCNPENDCAYDLEISAVDFYNKGLQALLTACSAEYKLAVVYEDKQPYYFSYFELSQILEGCAELGANAFLCLSFDSAHIFTGYPEGCIFVQA